MPVGKWSTFGECVGAQKRMGHGDESARKICGSIEAKAASELHPELKGAVFTECMENALKYYDQETAERVCGAAKAQYGSSQEEKFAAENGMSQQQDMQKEDGGPKITFSQAEMTQLVQAATDEGATKTLALLKEKVNIEEEGPGPAGPPQKKAPPFGR